MLKRLGFKLKDRTMEAFEETGMSPYHHAVLALLHEEPRETQAMIADALGYDPSHLVGVLDELEERGLIERKRDPSDRRRHLVSLTPDGEEALTRLRAVAKRVEDEFFRPLNAKERRTLNELLLRLAREHDPRYS
jgi:DNA-binding MarR family transcriptional regulator